MEKDIVSPVETTQTQDATAEHTLPAHITVDSEPVIEKTGTPYVAALAAFGIVLISIFFSMTSLVSYVIEKWLVKPVKDESFSYFDLSSFEVYAVIFAVAFLTIAIPVVVLLVKIVRNAEDKEAWRFQQKWRRIIYNVLIVIMVLSVISILVNVVSEVLYNNLKVYELDYSYTASSKPDTTNQILAASVSGLINVLIALLILVTILLEYTHKYRKVIWNSVAILVIAASIVSGFAILHVNKTVADARAERDKQEKQYSQYDELSNDDYTSLYNDTNTSNSATSMKNELENIKSDLSYYAEANDGKYPTTETWNSSSFKSQYLFSDEATLKKVTYTPSGCDTSACSTYTLSAKDDSGKDIQVAP